MFDSLGISDWVTASIMLWLAAQLPMGMFVGTYLRRVGALSTIGAVDAAPPYAQRRRTWQELLQLPAAPRAF